MSKALAWAITAMVFSASVSFASQQTPTYTKQSLQRHYLDLVLKEGFSGQDDANGDVTFNIDNRKFAIRFQVDDPHYVEIDTIDLWHPHAQDRTALLEAANRTMLETPTVKVLVTDKQVRFTTQFNVASPNDLNAHLPIRKKSMFGAAIADLKSAKHRFDALPTKSKSLTPLVGKKEIGKPGMTSGGTPKPPVVDQFQKVESVDGGYTVEMPGRPSVRQD